MTTKPGVIYIVHHVDTEGPLKEPLKEVFRRLENTLDIKIPIARTKLNLRKLQQGKWKSKDPLIVEEIKKLLDPHLLNLQDDWTKLSKMLKTLMSKNFRSSMIDSFGGGWIFNWHIMDHVGFKTNERSRDLGYFKIWDKYEKLIKNTNSIQDGVHWHFHPIPFFREAHISATSYENSYQEIHQILCRRLIEKNWFPRVNRAGFHTERPDSNWFLEQWIPFDPSNQAVNETLLNLQKDVINGRFGDWHKAPSDWSLYHPDLYDWRKKGNLNRVVARVLNLRGRFRNINDLELEKAFLEAKNGKNVYLGVTNHDWRDMKTEIQDFMKTFLSVSARFPEIKYKFSEAVVAFRGVIGFDEMEVKNNALDFDVEIKNSVLRLKVLKGEIFGPQPYLAIKTKKKEYFHDNFDFGQFKKEYFYTFDRYTIPTEKIEKICVASNDKYGSTCISTITFKKDKAQVKKFFRK